MTNLRVDPNDRVAVFAGVGEDGLVTLDAVGVVILEDVALAGQGLVALPAAEVARVPVLRHGLRVLSAENELFREEREKKKNIRLHFLMEMYRERQRDGRKRE